MSGDSSFALWVYRESVNNRSRLLSCPTNKAALLPEKPERYRMLTGSKNTADSALSIRIFRRASLREK